MDLDYIKLNQLERLRGEKKSSSSKKYLKSYLYSKENPKEKELTYEDRLRMMIYEGFYREDNTLE